MMWVMLVFGLFVGAWGHKLMTSGRRAINWDKVWQDYEDWHQEWWNKQGESPGNTRAKAAVQGIVDKYLR
jgi:hypothetical protein